LDKYADIEDENGGGYTQDDENENEPED